MVKNVQSVKFSFITSGMISRALPLVIICIFLCACSSGRAQEENSISGSGPTEEYRASFDADSAYTYVNTLVGFGPRVPNTEAHRRAGDWLVEKMKGFGWDVIEQKAVLTAFDGTPLQARNIFAGLNPEKKERTLLLAHWDSRPWADADPDVSRHKEPVPGANDGASGVGVLLEIARQLSMMKSDAAVDILFVDAEDWGSHNDEESWALGTRFFAANPPRKDYVPAQAILLDMVGSPDASFGYEYFSYEANPALLQKIWNKAAKLGYGKYFHKGFGGAVTDDHVELIKKGIPAIDIIDYRNNQDYQGFDPVWHTTHDNMENISAETLRATGETLISVLTQK